MTSIIIRMNSYENEKKDQNNKKDAAGTLMDMMIGKTGETSNGEEELAWNKLDDDNNCKAAAKPTNNIIEHDNCVVDANMGEKEELDNTDEGGWKWTQNLTLTAFTTRIMPTQALMGPLMVLIIE